MSDTFPVEPRAQPVRFTQIAVSAGQGQRDCLYALASDSSVWRLAMQHGNEIWLRVPPPPFGPVPADPAIPAAKPA